MRRITYILAILLLSTNCFAQGHFVLAFSGNGQDHMNIYAVTATVGGVALEAGDEIAAFDGAICCGKAILAKPIVITNSSTFAAIAASRADDGQSNGYTVGHSITYKFWDSSASKEISGITAEYLDLTGLTVPAPTYSINGSGIVKLSVSAPANHTPVSNAGPDQSVNEGDNVTLDGSASSDADSDPLSYSWTAAAGITLSSATAQKPTFTAPEVTQDTPYTFSLVVNDGTVNSTADQIVITVKQVNKIPVANAGPDQLVNEGDLVTLTGAASTDPDADPLTYRWTAPAGITLSSTTAISPTFTAPEVTVNTNYTISLVVNDGKANSAADQVVITVKQVNKAPVANAGPDQSPNEGTLVTLDGSASSDPDNDALTYLWTPPVGITLSSTTAQKPTFTAPEVTQDTPYTFSLVVNDGTVNSTADQVVVTVKQVNKIPVANAGPDQSVNEGDLVTLTGASSTDPDTDPLTYLWTAPAGITLSSTTAISPTFTAPEVTVNTDYTISLVVNDGKANSAADQVVITVKQVNKAPVANAGLDGEVTERKTFQLDGSLSSDFDHDALTYKWTAPSGITLNSTTIAKPTFTAPDVIANTSYTFSLIVNDGALDSPPDQVIITVIPNKAPVANAGPNQTVAQKQTVTLNGSLSSDPENDPLTYHWTTSSGITLTNPNTANPTFEAPVVTIDTDFSFKLKVNDGELDSPEDEVIIHVISNQLPIANAGVDFTANEGSNISLDGSGSYDPEGSSLTYKWTAPSGIALSSTTIANPSFMTPEVNQDTPYTFSLIVNDGLNDSPADQVIVTVKSVNKPPVANAGSDQSVDAEILVTLDGTASSDPDNDALTYLWTPPTGITLSSNTAFKPTFTAPNVTIDTNFNFKLTVSDGSIISSPDFVIITVKKVNHQPVANAGSDQSVNEGTLASLDGSASSDPDSDALTYLWIPPTGITLSSNTTAKPTFTAPEVTQNTPYTFSLTVNDGTVNSTADQVIVTVKQVNKAPVANAGPDQSVIENSVYTLDGSASSDPDMDAMTYKWTAPAGITLSSATAVKPTFTAPDVNVNTNYTFTLVVNDGKLDSPADQVTITVKQENKAPNANAGADQTVNEGTLVSLDGSASSDPDADALTYKWTAPSGITLSSTTATKPTFTAPEVTQDTPYTFSLVVNDGTVDSPADQVTITVKQVNKVPVANAGPDQSVNEGTTVTLDSSLSFDPDSDTFTYLWTAPAGITLSSTTVEKPTFTAPEVTSNKPYTFLLVVNDGTANSIADQVTITVINIDKAPYVKDSIKNISVDKRSPDQIIDLTTVFADDDFGDILSFVVTSNANEQVVTAKITGSNLTLSFSAENTGLSEILITASSNGKEAKSKFKVEVKIPNGIDLLADNSDIKIYPNPSKGNIQLKFSNTPKTRTWITVSDISGRIIHKSMVINKEEYLNLKGNPAGLYFIKIDGKNPKTYKIVLE